MRSLSLLLPASLFLLASTTGAQELPYPRDTAPISTVQVTAPAKLMRIKPEQAQVIGGTYAMSNGWIMKVRTASRYIDASIDREQPIRLLPVAPYKFASGDGNVTMEFNRGEWGEDMLMSYVPDPRLAQVVVISSELAQR